jgi:hypothetical protein
VPGRIAAIPGVANILKSGGFAMRIHQAIRTFLAAFWLLAAALAGLSQAALADVDVYTVSRIPVDVTAETAAAAREAALAEGHREAYHRLMSRLVLEADAAYVPDLDQGQIAQLVQDFSVVDEKTSAVRYLADLTFRFKPDAVRDLFRNYRLRFTETRSKPLLVLPVYLTQTGEVLLWEEGNLWAFAWAGRDLSEELVPLLIPLGDLGDVAAIDVEQAVAGDSVALTNIAQRYGAEGVLVVQAGLVGDPVEGDARLDVVADRYDGAAWRIYADSIAQQYPGGTDALFDAAIDAVSASVQADWKASNHLSFDDQRMLSAIVPVTELGDWLEVKKRLADIASITGTDLVYLSRQYAQVDIAYIGDEERLSRALAQNDLSLSRSALAGWELRLSGVGGAAVPLAEPLPPSEGDWQPLSGGQPDSQMENQPDADMESQPEPLTGQPAEPFLDQQPADSQGLQGDSPSTME